MTEIKRNQNVNEQNKKKFWDRLKSKAVSLGCTLALLGAGAMAGGSSAFAENSKDTSTKPSEPQVTATTPQKIDNTTNISPTVKSSNLALEQSNQVQTETVQPVVEISSNTQSKSNQNSKLDDLKAKYDQQSPVEIVPSMPNAVETQSQIELAPESDINSADELTNNIKVNADELNISSSDDSKQLRSENETPDEAHIEQARINTFNDVNARFKELSMQRAKTKDSPKIETEAKLVKTSQESQNLKLETQNNTQIQANQEVQTAKEVNTVKNPKPENPQIKPTNQPKIQTVGELRLQNTSGANSLKKVNNENDPSIEQAKRNTFDMVNRHFDELNRQVAQTDTPSPKKPNQSERNYGPAQPNDLGNPNRTTGQIVGSSSLSAVMPAQKSVNMSNSGVLLPGFASLDVNNLNFGRKEDGIYQVDFSSNTSSLGYIPTKETRVIEQSTPVNITNLGIAINLVLKNIENGEVSYLPASIIEANLLTNQTSRTTTNPSLGPVSPETVAEINKPGFFSNPQTTFGLNITGAGVANTGNPVLGSDNTEIDYGLTINNGVQNRKIQVNKTGSALAENTRSIFMVPQLERGQEAIFLTNVLGQLLPQMDVNLISNGKADPSLVTPDLVPFSQNVYRGDNPALSIANSSVSWADQLVANQAFPPVRTSGFNLGLANKYTQTITRRNEFRNLSTPTTFFDRSFDASNANLDISANVNGLPFSSAFPNVTPEVRVNLSRQTGTKDTSTTITKSNYLVPEFSFYTKEQSRTDLKQLVAGFTVDTVDKFEINPFLKAVFASYGPDGLYFTLAGQVYLIPNDSQRSKVSGTVGTNIKLAENVTIQPYFTTTYNFGGVNPADKTNQATIGLNANLGNFSISLGQLINLLPDSTTGTTAGVGFNSGDFRVRANVYNLNTGNGASAQVEYTPNKNNTVVLKFSTNAQSGATNPSNNISVLWNSSW